MKLTVQNNSTESIYRSMEYFQEDRDTDWVSYQPVVTCTLNNKINRLSDFDNGTTNEAYILGQKFYSSEPYSSNLINVVLPSTNPELTGSVNLLTQLSIDTPVYTNVDLNKYQIFAFGDNSVGRFLRIPKNCNQLKVLSFDIDNFSSATNIDTYIFGSEDNNNYFYLKKKIGNLNSFVFGYGKTETDITLDIVDNGRHSFKFYQTFDSVNNTASIEIHIDNVLKYTFNEDYLNIPSKSLFIFGMNSIRLTNKPCLAIGRKLLATNSDKFMYVSNVNQDLKDLYDPNTKNDKIYFPIDFTIKTLMGTSTGPYSLFSQTNIKTDEIYYVVHLENDTFKVVYMKSNYTVDLEEYEAIRKLQFEVSMKRSNVNKDTSDNTHNNVINNIEFKTFRKVTPSGTYKFRNNELVTLKTTFTAIINAMSAETKVWEFGVITINGYIPNIISVEVADTIVFDVQNFSNVSGKGISIVNALDATTIETNIDNYVNVNDKEQPHTSIIFVKEAEVVDTPNDLILQVSHPVINILYGATTEDVLFTSSNIDNIEGRNLLTVNAKYFDYALNIFQDNDLSAPYTSFNFNTKEIPLSDYFINNDNIITQVKEEIKESSFSFNTKEISMLDYFINNDNIISQVKEEIRESSFSFNTKSIPIESMKYNDNVIAQPVEYITSSSFSFNNKQTNDYLNVKNGYSQDTSYISSTPINLNGITVIKLITTEEDAAGVTSSISINAADKNYSSLINTVSLYRDTTGDYNNISLYSKTRNVLTSQTACKPYSMKALDDKLNISIDSMPRMITSSNIKITNLGEYSYDSINAIIDSVPILTTNTTITTIDINDIYTFDKVNSLNSDTTQVSMLDNTKIKTDEDLDSGSSLLNKEIASIPSPAIQLNPGVILQ